MGIFDNWQFAPQGYGGQGGGLLDMFRMMQSVPTQQPQGFLPTNNEPSRLDTAQWPAGPMSAPSALPQNATPAQGVMPQQPEVGGGGMQEPNFLSGIGNHFNAGLGSFIGNLHGGPIAALAGGIGGLLTGERNDPYGQSLKTQNLTVRALISRGVPPQDAALAASNPEMMKALLPRLWPTYQAHNIGNTGTAFNPATGEFKPGYTAPKVEKYQAGDRFAVIGGQPGQQTTVTPVGGLPFEPKFDEVTKLRTEIGNHPGVKRYEEAAPIFNSMIKSFGKTDRASDLDFVYGMAKIFDPDSVVREGEMVIVNKAQSLPSSVVGAINRLNGGQGLQEQTRRELLQVSKTRMEQYHAQAKAASDRYHGIVTRQNMNPADVLPNLTSMSDLPKAGSAAPDGIDQRTWDHMTPQERSLWKK